MSRVSRSIVGGLLAFLCLASVTRLEGQDDGPMAGTVDAKVASIFDKRCVRCHGPKKQKGRLRLDTIGGVSKVVTPGSTVESELYRRVTLDEDHEDAMPPSGKRLKTGEVEAIEAWIRAGAPMQAFDTAERRLADLARLQRTLEQTRRTSRAKITALDEEGRRLRVDFSLTEGPLTSRNLGALSRTAERIVELTIAGHPITSDMLNQLPLMLELERLHLERTAVGDAGMSRLVQRAPRLEYLNLHSTAVGNDSLRTLERLDQLQRLVLYGTGVDEIGLEAFRAARPDVRVTGNLPLPDEPFGAREPRRILAADASKKRVALLRESAIGHYETLWEHPIRQLHDLQLLDNGNVLFQESWTELLEVDPKSGEVLWRYDALQHNREAPDEPVEIHAFQRLDDGLTLIAESGPARLLEIEPNGRVRSKISLQVDTPHVHHDTRLVRKTPKGTYLVAHEADGAVREYDSEGRVVWSFEIPLFQRERTGGHGPEAWGNQVFAAERMANGNTLISTGNGHSVLEVSPAKEIVWHLSQDEIEGVRLAWVTTLQPLENGDLILGNCHAGPEQPQLLRISRDKELIWSFRDFDRFGNGLSNAWVVEDPYIIPGKPIPTASETRR